MSRFNFRPCPLAPGARVWAYLRDSGGDTQDLASQREYMRAYCEHHQLNLERVFIDAAVSGGSVVGRAEFEAMIDAARRSDRPLVDAVLYWDMKRFARDELDSQFYMADLRRRGYQLVSLSDDIPDGEFAGVTEAFLRWKAAKDRADISKDSARGLAFIVGLKDADGNYLGIFPGRPPTFFATEQYNLTEALGIRRNDGSERVTQRIVPDPEMWPKGQRAFRMRAEGAAYPSIEAELSLFPDSPQPSSIYSTIFRNEIYIGRLHYGGRVYEDFVPALVDQETWQAVQKRHRQHGLHRRSTYLLSGLCRCMYCQGRVYGGRNTRKGRKRFWRYYICNQKKMDWPSCQAKQTSADKLERAVIDTVCGQLTPGFVGRLVDRINLLLSDEARAERQIEKAQAEIVRLGKIIQNLVKMAELSPSASLASQLDRREAERSQAERELEQLRAESHTRRLLVSPQLVGEVLSGYRSELQSGPVKARQKLLRHFLERVDLGRDVARLHLKVEMSHVLQVPPTATVPNVCWEAMAEL